MKNALITSLILATAISTLPLASHADETVVQRKAIQWLPLTQVIEQVQSAGFTNVEEIEREHGHYEATATSSDGVRTKLWLDAQTGSIVKQHERKARQGKWQGQHKKMPKQQ